MGMMGGWMMAFFAMWMMFFGNFWTIPVAV